MSRYILLFSGQGAQKTGMGKDWAENSATVRELVREADEILGFPLSKAMFDGSEEELTRTSICQPALYLHGMMALALLRKRLPAFEPVAAAGLSLGEFTAHAAAGTFSFANGLRLVARRGEFMERACESADGAMAAMIGGDEAGVRKLADDCGVDVANLNAPGQIVLSGATAGIDAAVAKARDFGIRRAIKLNVAGAYHSRLMQPAQDLLAGELKNMELHTPKIPVVCNFTADTAADPETIRTNLERQVTGSVRWIESVRRLAAMGTTTCLELGPGKVLAGLVAKIEPTLTVHSIEDLASLEAAIETLS
jgi:[acyl-carrier-protein] S-malonyltransferase